ncbi:Ecm33p, partial [Ascoidea rubescens DSM 1968]
CESDSGFAIQNQGDLDTISSCSTLEGDVIIQGSIGTAALPGVTRIKGSLIIKNATSLVSFSADSLQIIDDELSLTDLTILDNLNLPVLTQVGSIYFVTLPALSEITLTTGISKVDSLYISDTALETLSGINVVDVDTFNVNNNRDLQAVDGALKTVKTSLEVSYNSETVEVSFDNLIWANNVTFRDVSSISMSNLTAVNGSMGVYNTTIDSLVIDNLETVGGALAISHNNELTDLEFASLVTISGALDITNNSALTSITGFPKLKTVGGAIDIGGALSNVTFPSLKSVRGGATFYSSVYMDCSKLKALHKKGVIQGDDYSCRAAKSSSSSGSGSGSGSGSATGTASGSDASGTIAASGTGSSSDSGSPQIAFSGVSIISAFAAALLSLL